MCSTDHLPIQNMENYQGDLADIFRASGNTSSGDHLVAAARSPLVHHHPDWEMFHHHPSSSSDPILNYPTEGLMESSPTPNFGHPFNILADPLLEDLDNMPDPGYFISASTAAAATTTTDAAAASAFGQKIVLDHNNDHMIKSGGGGQPHHHPNIVNNNNNHHNQNYNRNIFSRMLQISPINATTMSTSKLQLPVSPPCDHHHHRGIVLKAPPPPPPPTSSSSTSSSSSLILSTNDVINANTSSKAGCLVENNALQISSPRNTGIKRRKSQAKKVVCIPAPAPANSRSTGEVVPSDLWAWRKYGQKPIKGSPYPRGYYRCSSSKGCSARKQVERSRTDPNMLVITYTSEHNHPWPTQRNALAGSTRNQPSKNNNSSKSSPPAPSSQGSQKGSLTSLKEEPKDHVMISHDHSTGTMNTASPASTVFGNSMAVDADHDHAMVKEENMEEFDKEADQMDDHQDGDHEDHYDHQIFSSGHDHEGFPQSYRPVLPADQTTLISQQQLHHHQADQDFFADLGEIETDPLNLLFTHGFSGDDDHDHEEREDCKSLDPFTFYDWAAAGNHINSTATATTTTTTPSSYGEAKRPEGL